MNRLQIVWNVCLYLCPLLFLFVSLFIVSLVQIFALPKPNRIEMMGRETERQSKQERWNRYEHLTCDIFLKYDMYALAGTRDIFRNSTETHYNLCSLRHKLHQFDGDMEMNCEINWGRTLVVHIRRRRRCANVCTRAYMLCDYVSIIAIKLTRWLEWARETGKMHCKRLWMWVCVCVLEHN